MTEQLGHPWGPLRQFPKRPPEGLLQVLVLISYYNATPSLGIRFISSHALPQVPTVLQIFLYITEHY